MKTKEIIYLCAMFFNLISCQTKENTLEWIESPDSNGSDLQNASIYYQPIGAFVGDVMPFYDPLSKEFKLMYLQDYRPNPPYTFHPIWGVTTKDGTTYQELGELIPCGSREDLDAAIGTGSTVYDTVTKLYYTFYTGHTVREEVVMMATSSDFKTWIKNRGFILRGDADGYSKNDFRDPFVFKGDDGAYHMIVSTVKDGKGVLAEYKSDNLKQWNHVGVFMTMMWDRFYECPDIFKMGDWWYLVYSEKHGVIRRVQYFKAKSIEELKNATLNDRALWPDDHEGFLDSRGYYAAKTASDGKNRYIWGWCPTRPGNNNTLVGPPPGEPEWAGTMVAHRIVQHAAGTLSLGEIEAVSNKFSNENIPEVEKQSGTVQEKNDGYSLAANSFVLFNRLSEVNKITFTVKATDNAKFGFSFVRGNDSSKYYSLIVNPEDNNNKRKINFEEEGSEGKGFIAGIDSYLFQKPTDNVYRIKVYTDNSVCVVYINDNVAYTNRIYGIQKNPWSINCYNGAIEVADIKVATFK